MLRTTTLSLLLAAALLATPLTSAAESKAGGSAPAKVTLTGELVDMACYLSEGEKGPSHQQCATLCAKDGIPVGLLTADGKVYTLVVAASALAPVMALQAEVTGSVHGEAIIPESLKVKKGDAWQPVKLPQHM